MGAVTRREFMRLIGRAAPAGLIGPAATGAWAVAFEPTWLEVRVVPVTVPGLDPTLNGLRVGHLSDIHRSDIVSGHHVQNAVAMLSELRPEVIALTGDFITGDPEYFAVVARDLAPLAAVAPVYATPGNHDYLHRYPWSTPRLPEGGERLGEALDRVGIELLRNESRLVTLRGGSAALRVVGCDDLWARGVDPRAAFGTDDDAAARLVLCHNPDAFGQLAAHRFDLMLCGHTHGGQVRLPLIGTPYCPIEDRRFVAGLAHANDRLVYTNRGLGYNRGVRLGVRPEVALLELRAA